MPNKNVNDSINAKMLLAGAVTSSLPLYYSIIIRNTDLIRPRVSQFWPNCAHLDARSKSGTAFGSAALGHARPELETDSFQPRDKETCYITATRHESWKQRLSHSCGFRGTPTVNRILCSAGQKPDFRRSPHTVTLNLFGVDLLPNIYTGMRGRNAYLIATIPTFEDASWTRHLLPYWRGPSGISRLSPRALRAWVRGYS